MSLPPTHLLPLQPPLLTILHRLPLPVLVELLTKHLPSCPPIQLPDSDAPPTPLPEALTSIQTLGHTQTTKKRDVTNYLQDSVYGAQFPMQIIAHALVLAAIHKSTIPWSAGRCVLASAPDTPVETHTLSTASVVSEIESSLRGIASRWFISYERHPDPAVALYIFLVLAYPSASRAALSELPPRPYHVYFSLGESTPIVLLGQAAGGASPVRDAVLAGVVRAVGANVGRAVSLRSTSLGGKDLSVVWGLRGAEGHASRGAWSVYQAGVETGPLDHSEQKEDEDVDMRDVDEEEIKKARIDGRFGQEAAGEKGIERATFELGEQWSGFTPRITVQLEGTHVWRGMRKWVEEGLMDAEKCPAWVTGEDGVSIGSVVGGRVKGRAQI